MTDQQRRQALDQADFFIGLIDPGEDNFANSQGMDDLCAAMERELPVVLICAAHQLPKEFESYAGPKLQLAMPESESNGRAMAQIVRDFMARNGLGDEIEWDNWGY